MNTGKAGGIGGSILAAISIFAAAASGGAPESYDLVFSTYLGGGDWDYARDVCADAQGNAYVPLCTDSMDWPTTPGVLQPAPAGGTHDIGVVKLDGRTGALLLGTYLGGSGTENADGVYVDEAGNVFISGETASADFPVTPGAFQSAFGGNRDAFVALLSADFTHLLYCSCLGGPNYDNGRSGFMDQKGNLYLAGACNGPGWPARNAFQSAFAGGPGEWGAGDCVLAGFMLTQPQPPASGAARSSNK